MDAPIRPRTPADPPETPEAPALQPLRFDEYSQRNFNAAFDLQFHRPSAHEMAIDRAMGPN